MVPDQQQVDAPQPFLEGQRRLALHGGDEMVHEVVSGQVDDVASRLRRAGRPGDGVEQVGLAQADARMDIDGVEAHRVVGGRMGDLPGHLHQLVDSPATKLSNVILGSSALPEKRVAARRRGNSRRVRGDVGVVTVVAFGLADFRRGLGLLHARPGLAVHPHREVQAAQIGQFDAKGIEKIFSP